MTDPTPTQWTLQGTLVNAGRQPVQGATVTVYPPAESYNDVPGDLLTKPITAVSDSTGAFSMLIDSVPGIVWLVQVDDDEPVTIPDPGPGQTINVNRLTPAYVPNWQGGKRVAVGAGVASMVTSGTNLITTLTNGTTLPPVPLWSGSALDSDESARALLPFAKAHLASGSPKVVVIGQADAEGAGASAPGSRWLSVLADALRDNYADADSDRGVGYIPARYADTAAADSLLGTSIVGSVDLADDAGGLGFRTAVLEADPNTAATVTWPAQDCSSITVYYPTDPYRKGTFQVWVDGVKVASLSNDPGSGTPVPGNEYTWQGPRGQHTLSVVRDVNANSQAALVHGASFATAPYGIQVFDSSRGGTDPQTADMLAHGPADARGVQARMYQSLTAIDPDLVILALGQADMSASTYLKWGADLASTLAQVTAACPNAGVLLLHSPMLPSDATSTGPGGTHLLTQFEDTARNAVATKSGASMLSLGRVWQPATDGSDPWGWFNATTGLPTDVAHSLTGNYLVRLFREVLTAGLVTSVAGRSGAVTLTAADIQPSGGALNPAVLSGGTPEAGSYPDGSGAWTALPTRSTLAQQRGLIPFKQALSTGTARVAFVGDGKAEGAGASSIAKRWSTLLTQALRSQAFSSGGTDQGVGYVPCWNTAANAGLVGGDLPTLQGQVDADYTLVSNGAGFGLRSVKLLTTAAGVTFPATTFRYLTVAYTAVTSGGGSFNVLVDGKVQATVNTTMTGQGTVVANGMGVGTMTVDLSTVDVRQVSFTTVSGTPTVEGATFATSTSGLSTVDDTRMGFTVGAQVQPGSPQLELAALTRFDPHLVVLATGTNEQSASSDVSWRQDLGTYLGLLRAACPNAGVLMLQGAARPIDAATPGVGLARSHTFDAGAQRVCDDSCIASVTFESSLWQPTTDVPANPAYPTEQDPFGWLSDDEHPTDMGHARIAEHLTQVIIPGSGAAVNANSLTTAVLDSALASDMSNQSSASRAVLDATYERRDLFQGLLPWRAAYAGRASTAVPVTVISGFEGVGATDLGHTWQQLLRSALNGGSGGPGLIRAAYSASSGLTSPVTFGTGTAPVTSGSGFGGTVLRVASGDTVTFPATKCTGIRVWYRGASGSGTASVVVDTGSPTTIDGTVATEAGILPATGWTALTSGSHTVKVSASGGTFDLMGVEYANADATSGVHLFDSSQQEVTAATVTSAAYTAGMLQVVKATNPALLVVMLGTGDFNNGADTFTSSLPLLRQNIDAVLAGTTYSVLLAMPPRPVVSGAPPASKWDSFVTAARSLAAAYPSNYAFVDLQQSWPSLVPGGSTSLGLMAEADFPVNFSPSGHQAVADALYRVLG